MASGFVVHFLTSANVLTRLRNCSLLCGWKLGDFRGVVDALVVVAFPTTLTVPSRRGVRSWSLSACIRAWLEDMLRSRSMLAFELRGRLLGGSGEAGCANDVLEAFESCNVLASEAVDVLAAMLSTSLWNLRFVVANAGCVSVILSFAQRGRGYVRWSRDPG